MWFRNAVQSRWTATSTATSSTRFPATCVHRNDRGDDVRSKFPFRMIVGFGVEWAIFALLHR